MDFEAKAREVADRLGQMKHGDAVALLADALRAAALDEGVREATRAELARLLVEVKARALNPPRVVDFPEAAPWDTSPQPSPAAAIQAVAQAAAAHDMPLVIPPRSTWTPLGLEFALERLLWLLNLSEGERRFVAALADDAGDFTTLEVFSDWLEDEGRTADGRRVRRLVPQDGDVILWRVPRMQNPDDIDPVVAARPLAQGLCDRLMARGVETLWLVLPADAGLETAPPDAMRAAGWVRAADVAHRLRHLAEQVAGNPYLCPETVREDIRSVADAFSAPRHPRDP